MRALKLFSVYIGVIAVVMAIIFIPNWDEFQEVFDNIDGLKEGTEFIESTYSLGGLIDYLVEQPQYTAIYSLSGDPSQDAIAHNPEQMHTMGALQHLLAAAYLYELEHQGIAVLAESHNWKEISLYQLPNYYYSNHASALDYLEDIEALSDNQVPVTYLIDAMIVNNDYAIHDFLVHTYRLDTLSIDESYSIDNIQPFAGLALMMHPGVRDKDFETLISEYREMDIAQFNEQSGRYFEDWVTDSQKREAFVEIFEEEDYGLTFLEEKQTYDLYPHASARSFTLFMKDILEGNRWNSELTNAFTDHLRWMLEDRAVNYQFYDYGGGYESRIGLLNGFDFGIVDSTDSYRYQTVFFDQVPIALWFHLSSNFMNQDYQRRLIWDPELRNRTKQAVENTSDSAASPANKTQSAE